MLNFLLSSTASASAASSSATTTSSFASLAWQIIPIILIFVLLYFFMIRPQQKRQKEEQKMRSNLQVGDEILTVGGIIGRVVSLKDDTILIETGSDRSKIRIVRSAIQTNITAKEGVSSETPTAKVEDKPL